MINKDEYIKVNYIDFLTVCDEHNKCYDVEDSRGASHVDDLMYPGNYLSRHARARKRYYQVEKLKVILVKRPKHKL